MICLDQAKSAILGGMSTGAGPDQELRKRIEKAAHDVRSPLTSIAGFAQLLVDDAGLNSEARENAELILGESRRLFEMLEAFFTDIAETIGPNQTSEDEH